jgi:hypothetical protein
MNNPKTVKLLVDEKFQSKSKDPIFPLKEIDNIQFYLTSPEEIIKQSVCEVTTSKLSGPGSVYDKRMGSMEQDEICESCGQGVQKCPGHAGHIILNTFILHPMFMRHITNFLKCLCVRCYRVVLTNDHLGLEGIMRYQGDNRFEKIVERLDKVDSCFHCKSPKPKISFVPKTSDITMKYEKTKIILTDTEIKKIFDNVPDSDVSLMGFNPIYMHPKNLVLSVLQVMPPRARPYIISDSVTCDDDLTISLCFAPNTPIRMWDGTVKKCKDIEIGDELIGDDGNITRVTNTCKGMDIMYEVSQSFGESYVVNSKHKLVLKNSCKEIVDIPVNEYLKMTELEKYPLRGFKSTGVNWPTQKVYTDSYVIGIILGEGLSTHFPNECLVNDRETRLQVLAGLIDSDEQHSLIVDNSIWYSQCINILEDVVVLIQSLGFSVSVKYKCDNNMVLSVYGNIWEIPLRKPLGEKIIDPLLSIIDVKEIGYGGYCGFSVDNVNKRFLLGDFTVVSNCEIIKANRSLNDPDVKGIKKDRALQNLKFRIKTMMNNSQNKSKHSNGRPLKCIKGRLSGKTGLIRQNLMGKRRNQSGRSPISADPTVRTDELVVPEQIARNLTVPETVVGFNKDFLQKLVDDGKANFVLRGDTRINLKYATCKKGTQIMWGDKILRSGKTFDTITWTSDGTKMKKDFELESGDQIIRTIVGLDGVKKEEIIKDIELTVKRQFPIEIGDIVERHLRDNDVTLFNRQPTEPLC